MSLEEITRDLGVAYALEKEASSTKTELRGEFFEVVTKLIGETSLAQKTVSAPGSIVDIEDARMHVAKYHPGWKIIEEPTEPFDDEWTFILEEDPAYLKYVYVNPSDQMVYQRQVASGGVYIDDERLREEDPELWQQVTVWENYDLLAELLYANNVGTDEIDERLETFAKSNPTMLKRVLMAPDDLSAELVSALGEYSYEGPPTIKLAAPRKAKPGELEEE